MSQWTDISEWGHGENIDSELERIPTASLKTINMEGIGNPESMQAVIVNDRLVGTVSKRYGLVQHKEAFAPIVQGLRETNAKFRHNLWYTNVTAKKAFLDVFTQEADDSVQIGFRVVNTINGTGAIRYAFSSFTATSVIELVGYRQVCANGMKLRVPLHEAEIVKVEERMQIEKLLESHAVIRHTTNANTKLQMIQLAVEAMQIMKEPVARMIRAARGTPIAKEYAKQLIGEYIGKRLHEEILAQYSNEEQNIWGLYNAITNVASHNSEIAQSTANGLINNSAIMLEEVVAPRPRKRA